MSKLITKARAGVTLVELLVVILIVTILSVSMLPLLKPFVVEAQYAAEAIPVIGNLRTKIGLYQYDKGQLPCAWAAAGANFQTPCLEGWIPSADGTTASSDETTWGSVDRYVKGALLAPTDKPGTTTKLALYDGSSETDDKIRHFGTLCDIDYQDLKGKRSRPNDYQYLVVKNGSDYMYCVGCFGDGNGLPKGTGYAVCEIVMANHKYVGTWKRYKPVSDTSNPDGVQLCFTSSKDYPTDLEQKDTYGCYVPTTDELTTDGVDSGDGKLGIVAKMIECGWEF